jgi:hypothetical protein
MDFRIFLETDARGLLTAKYYKAFLILVVNIIGQGEERKQL